MESENTQLININGKVSPAVLASLLGINVSMVHQGRQDGKLPPNSSANYRECLNHYINYWKSKSASKVSNVSEAALLQKIKLDTAKTEMEWLNIKQKKQELLDMQQLETLFEPVFIHIRTRLVSISRKHPETIPTIDQAMEELFHLGKDLFNKGQEELDAFITTRMNEEVEVEEPCEPDTPLNSFDDYVSSQNEIDDADTLL
jgi:hypothetical protein